MSEPLERAGMMKSAFIPSAFLSSCGDTRLIVPLIFNRAEARFNGLPVMSAAPLSAENSRYLDSALINMKLINQTATEAAQINMRLPLLLSPKKIRLGQICCRT